ncbi:hypothetical protein Q3G72_025519 [Acer saccharum]|nr:hypothetical protein Q3G72_025519 [Acer saccharum]
MTKIIIQVKVNDDKCRVQALKIAAAADVGVIFSFAWEGKGMDKMKLMVFGLVCLLCCFSLAVLCLY